MSTDRLPSLLSANARFTATFQRGDLKSAPRKKLVVLTCMDCRIAVEELFGLEVGDVAVVRNAGAVATDDAIRSVLLTRYALGTDEVLVMGHTGCGLSNLDDANLQLRLTLEFGESEGTKFGSFDDLEAHVREQVERIRDHPWIGDAPVHGLVYEVETGRARPVSGT